MNRRDAIGVLAGSPLLAAAADGVKPQYYELRKIQLRNGTQPQRTNDFFAKHFMPAAKKAGLGPVGVFAPNLPGFGLGDRSPYLLFLLTYSSFAAAENTWNKLVTDPSLAAAYNEWHKPLEPGFVRSESSLLVAFNAHPQLRVPPATPGGHIFELRTYESNNEKTLRRKIEMFNGGEMQIFQRLGMLTVFFGETLIGDRMPNLTYMLGYKDLATRESLWKAFEGDPEFVKLRTRPGLSDGEIVADITSTILGPAPYSDIR
jgi:hypothetical protein